MANDYANLIPAQVTRDLMRATIQESAILRLGRRINMPSGMVSIPFASLMPTAAFVAARGGRKPATTIEWSTEQLTPEEIALVTSIPNDFLEDNGFPLWDEVRPLLAQAIGIAIDNAGLWGVGAPASWPTGGIEAVAGAPVTGVTTYDAISAAMGAVEASGTLPTGHVVGPTAGHALRTLRDENGNLVFQASPAQGAPDQLFGLPIARSWTWATTGELITGDWTKAVVGIRQDIRYDLSTEGVLTDGAGAVTVNAFQDDSTLMRAYMRVGFAIGAPVNASGVAVAPFKIAEFTAVPAGLEAPAGTPSPSSPSSSSSGDEVPTAANTRGELDAYATRIGLDPSEYRTKDDVADAIAQATAK